MLRLFLENSFRSIVFWELTGIVGITVAVSVYFSSNAYSLLSYLSEPTIRHYFIGLLWVWLSCILIACIVNVFYGTIVQLTYE